MNEAWFHRIKAAQRDLIRRAGGIERASEITSISKSHIGRMNNPADPELMPLPAVIALEADTFCALVTAVMAEANGRRVTDPDAQRASDVSVMASHAELMRQSAELANGMAIAISDGMVTPTEATSLDRIAANLEEAASRMRVTLATIKSTGGVSAGLRVVGEKL